MIDAAYPAVDVLIPVCNGARFLAEAICSVLSQTYPAYTIYVIDDGSTDESAVVAAGFPGVRVLRQPHRGIGAALNLALRHASGELLASLDADDRWRLNKLEQQVHTLRAEPSLDGVFCYAQQFYTPAESTGAVPPLEAPLLEAPQPGIHRGGLLVRRTAFDRVGLYAEDTTIHQFVDWYARACEAGLCMRVLPDVLYERRVHEENKGRRMPAAQRESYLRALRAAVARRNQQSDPGAGEAQHALPGA